MPPGNGNNGQDPKTGRFLPGNTLGNGGDPIATKRKQFRCIVAKALTPQRMGKIAATLLRCAERGEPWAVKEVLDRLLGKAKEHVEIDATITLQDALAAIYERRRSELLPDGRN